MGVEPTWDRPTAPPGFEVRSPHRERDSSIAFRRRCLHRAGREQADARRIDAAQVLPADGEAVPVEELEDLDRHLAAVVKPVAELGRGELAVGGTACHVDGDLGHALHNGAQEEVVGGDLVDVAPPRQPVREVKLYPPLCGRPCLSPASSGSAAARPGPPVR